MKLSQATQRRLRHWVYLGGFFLNSSIAISAYVNSSFIEQFTGERHVGLVYALTSLLMLAIGLQSYRIVERWGLRRTILSLITGNLLVISGLVAFSGSPAAVFLLTAYSILNFLLAINLDHYLEHLSADSVTGTIRGIFLTLVNLAWLLSPLLASLVLGRYHFAGIYLVSGLALSPLLLLTATKLREMPKGHYEQISLGRSAWAIWRARPGSARADLRRILTLDFLLNFFYATMVIYIPIYLHQHIGLTWQEIGIILTIMLVPFVLLDLILGKLADAWLGEQELLVAGIAIAAGATLVIPLLDTTSIWAWGALLFTTRVGGATIEMMKESYLFKRIDSADINTLFISRSLYPLSYITAPLIASALLWVAPYHFIFTVLGAIVLLGLPAALSLADTR